MRFHRVIEINEAYELKQAVRSIFENMPLMPHLHQGADHPFRLAIGLRTIDAGKLLADAVLRAGTRKGMVRRAFVLLAVIGIGILDLIGALGNDCLGEKARSAILCLIGQDGGIQLA